jgi:hypothetical protein
MLPSGQLPSEQEPVSFVTHAAPVFVPRHRAEGGQSASVLQTVSHSPSKQIRPVLQSELCEQVVAEGAGVLSLLPHAGASDAAAPRRTRVANA